ncbi:hypothetical protein K466DRAFT_647246 [Polyporus arcularius HHB13444]|uniref:Uncharacterized protein n=1 Tax=Polyporus arcularius HHB13444 TaxID=1314778 RepID=A0A5C3P742_9APHY|nr:hypothetical protein K466DRAFT_647246 [Polyporus arcularius HHB13444]
MAPKLPITLNHAKLSTSVHALCHALLKVWLLAWPLAFPGGMALLQYCRCATHSEKGLITRMRKSILRMCAYWRPAREDEYWRSSARMREALRASDAGRDGSDVPLVRYYTPKLLPAYRDHDEVEEDPEAREVYVAPRAFCKWHRMVFRGPMHPTLKEAQEQIRYYSSRDRREILRISRLLCDEQVFRKRRTWTPHFARTWRDWLNRKGPDVAIVFA